MTIIKLTDLQGKYTYINKNHIESFYECNNHTEIWTICADKTYIVKETPEEILALIKEAENGKRIETL